MTVMAQAQAGGGIDGSYSRPGCAICSLVRPDAEDGVSSAVCARWISQFGSVGPVGDRQPQSPARFDHSRAPDPLPGAPDPTRGRSPSDPGAGPDRRTLRDVRAIVAVIFFSINVGKS